MQIENIVFDIGGVLLKNNFCEFLSDKITYKEDISIINDTLLCSEERKALDLGILSEKEMLDIVIQKIPARSRDDAISLYYEYMHCRTSITGMPEIIERLKANGYKLYILSNFGTNYDDLIKWNKMEYLRYFNGIFISSKYHMIKPDKKIYEKFLAVNSLFAQKCFFIDDNKENIRFAEQMGFVGCVFTGIDKLKKKFEENGVIYN